MFWLKQIFKNWCWHDWWIIYEGGYAMFVEIECKKCGRKEHRGAAG